MLGLKMSVPILLDLLVLLYGASFTLTLNVFQAFATAGLESVKEGVHVLRQSGAYNPASFQTIFSGLYAGGFAALTVLRNEAAAAIAIGVDMGWRVGSLLEGLLPRGTVATVAAEPEEMAPIGDGEQKPPAVTHRTPTTDW